MSNWSNPNVAYKSWLSKTASKGNLIFQHETIREIMVTPDRPNSNLKINQATAAYVNHGIAYAILGDCVHRNFKPSDLDSVR